MTTFRMQFFGVTPRGREVTKRFSVDANHWSDAIDRVNEQHGLPDKYTLRRYDFSEPQRCSAFAIRIARNAGPEEA